MKKTHLRKPPFEEEPTTNTSITTWFAYSTKAFATSDSSNNTSLHCIWTCSISIYKHRKRQNTGKFVFWLIFHMETHIFAWTETTKRKEQLFIRAFWVSTHQWRIIIYLAHLWKRQTHQLSRRKIKEAEGTRNREDVEERFFTRRVWVDWRVCGQRWSPRLDMYEDDGLAFLQQIINSPFQSSLAVFVSVDGHSNQSIHAKSSVSVPPVLRHLNLRALHKKMFWASMDKYMVCFL